MTLYVYVTMKYFDSDMSNSTNTVVYFDEKGGNYVSPSNEGRHIVLV